MKARYFVGKVFFLVILIKLNASENPLLVKVEQGWLQGEELDLVTKDGTYYSFKGISYAAAPIGVQRFKAPLPPPSWDGIRNATAHGAVCPQKDILTGLTIPGSEDCLFLNVYTQNMHPETLMPVIFYIHGGGFKSGSGNSDNYGPDFLIPHGVILVTINYRLEVLGFLNMETKEVPGNAGLKDQVAALRWVKKNIAKFGGNPNNIVAMGQSAGGVSAALHALSPMSKDLINKVIDLSGSPSSDWVISYFERKHAFNLGSDLGFRTRDTDALLEYLQSLPSEKLIDHETNVFGSEQISQKIVTRSFPFTPSIEKDFGQERFILNDPYEELLKGGFDKPLMTGHTSAEGATVANLYPQWVARYDYYSDLLVPKKLTMKCGADLIDKMADLIRDYYFDGQSINNGSIPKFIKYVSESNFNYQIAKYAEAYTKQSKSDVYLYRFSYFSERNVYGANGVAFGVTGAGHMDDLLYLFNAPSMNLTAVDVNSEVYNMINTECTLVANFAKYGNPTPDQSLGTTWPKYDTINKLYLDIEKTMTVGSHMDADMIKFWDSLYELSEQCQTVEKSRSKKLSSPSKKSFCVKH